VLDLQAALNALRAADPVMGQLIDRFGPLDLEQLRAGWVRTPFLTLNRGITGQQISGHVAEAIYGRLMALIGDRDPAPAIAAETDEALLAVGLSHAKLASLRDLVARALDGRLELDRLEELSDDEVFRQLTAVRGIGPWTAELFLLGQLARPDILPAGDLGIRQAAGTLYRLDRIPTEKEVRVIGERWRPYRSIATRYLYASLRPPA
jgi:DNA-3-methyladenine glycosylase II